MSTNSIHNQAAGTLQELGLKEYEAEAFVGLSRVPSASAKELSDISDVPRTRVYDAIRVLEAYGLVEIHHSNPQRFRAVPLSEAVKTLRSQFESRIKTLSDAIEDLEPAKTTEQSVDHQAWTLTSTEAITNRTQQLIQEATDEVVLVIGDEAVLSDGLVASLNSAVDEGRTVVIGAVSDAIQTLVQEAIPGAKVFVSGIEWLHDEESTDGQPAIGRMLLVDRGTILVSAVENHSRTEHAIFGKGFGNGLVVIARRLLATGLLPIEDPGSED